MSKEKSKRKSSKQAKSGANYQRIVVEAKNDQLKSDQLSPEMELQLDELSKLPTPQKRIWEIDFLRGFLILFVVMDHFFNNFLMIPNRYFTTEFWQKLYYTAERYLFGNSEGLSILGKLRLITHDAFVYAFVLASGISSSFSRNNLIRGIRMSIFALLFTGFTYAFQPIVNTKTAIGFNIIHVIALSVLLYSLLEFLFKLCKKNWQKNIFGGVVFVSIVLMLFFGHYFVNHPIAEENGILVVVLQNAAWRKQFVDYWPLLPSFGWFLIGVYLGKNIYKQKTTLFPTVNEKYLSPVTFIGRYSLWFYFGTQVVMFGGLYLLAVVLNVL